MLGITHLKLTLFRGHPRICVEGVHDAKQGKEANTIPARVSVADGAKHDQSDDYSVLSDEQLKDMLTPGGAINWVRGSGTASQIEIGYAC